MIRIGINGFGRIGRVAFRSIVTRPDVEVVAINDLLDVHQLAYLLTYDSFHGRFPLDVQVTADGNLQVGDAFIRVTAFKDPSQILWDAAQVDVVIESSGYFTAYDKAMLHLQAGAKKVVISAPSKDAKMFVMGVNHHELTASDLVFSNASCTTNCLAPILKVLDDNFGFAKGMMTTVHSATSSQNIIDGGNAKPRRGRTALNNIIPTSTSAAEAVVKVLPTMQGNLTCMAVRVPVPNVSLIDLTFTTKKSTDISSILASLKNASNHELKGIIGYTEDPVVSQDFVSETRTSVVDASAAMQLDQYLFKIISWYDNEFGYATKLVDLVEYAQSL